MGSRAGEKLLAPENRRVTRFSRNGWEERVNILNLSEGTKQSSGDREEVEEAREYEAWEPRRANAMLPPLETLILTRMESHLLTRPSSVPVYPDIAHYHKEEANAARAELKLDPGVT